jgi:hypothetical protein
MELSLDAVRQIEQDLLTKTDVLAHYLRAYGSSDEDGAARVLAEIVERLHRALSLQAGPKSDPSSADERSSYPPTSRTDPIEEFILENLANSARGLSVQEIVERFEEAEIEMKRPTLVVRLHRLVRAGKLASRAHGHYALSENEYGRRHASSDEEYGRRQSA